MATWWELGLTKLSIRAFTLVGEGPFSTTVTGRTSEDGKMELV